jgi:hypothetical protein
VRRALHEQNYRKWKSAKRIPLTMEVAKDRYAFVCYWLKHLEDLLRVRCLGVAPYKLPG